MIKKSPVLKQGFSIVVLDLTFINKFKKVMMNKIHLTKTEPKMAKNVVFSKKLGLVNKWI